MKHYWTPLAQGLGLTVDGSSPITDPSAWERNPWSWLVQGLTAHVQFAMHGWQTQGLTSDTSKSLWIQGVRIRPLTDVMAAQLSHLNVALGPDGAASWIRQVIDDVGQGAFLLESPLQVCIEPLRRDDSLTQRPSAYAFEAAGQPYASQELEIEFDDQWLPLNPPAPDVQIAALMGGYFDIVDAQGSRRLPFTTHSNTWVFGSALNGASSVPLTSKDSDPQTIEFMGGQALFIRVQGRHVSRKHLAVRRVGERLESLDLSSTNGTYDHSGRMTFSAGEWRLLSRGQTLYLGGAATDGRGDSPSLSIHLETPKHGMGLATPMRAPDPPKTEGKPIWEVFSPGTLLCWQIDQLPFRIGRDPSCAGVVPATHRMVSRQHLVIEAIDEDSGHWRVKDLSSQRLTHWTEPIQALPDGSCWLSPQSQVTIGQTSSQSGLTLCLRCKASVDL